MRWKAGTVVCNLAGIDRRHILAAPAIVLPNAPQAVDKKCAARDERRR